MTAIADIIVNQSNPANLQLSQNIKDSLSSDSTTSFAELVASYQEPVKEDSAVENKTEALAENTDSDVKTAKSDEVKEPESTEEKTPVEKTETKEKSVKTEAKNESKTVKNNDSEKTEVKDLKKKVSKTEASKEQNAQVEVESKVDENNLKYFEEYTASLMNNQISETKENADIEIDLSDAEIAAEVLIPGMEVSEQLQLTQIQDSEEMDFSDLAKKPAEKKALKADKEGKITVQDLRTEKVEVAEKNEPKLKTQLKVTSENTATMTMTYAEESVQGDVLSLNNQTAASNGSTFQSMLNNQVQQNVPEFVKAGNIVLKDNNQGTINLILHPDDLGNVKIHLSLDGKSLTGHITVATKEAMQVFKDNSETLREAFIKSGFETANFEVTYGGNGGNHNQDFAFDQRNDGTNIFGRQMYSSVGDAASSEDTAGISEIQEHFGNYSVNIVA